MPVQRRDATVTEAIDTGVAFLLARDPAVAEHPMEYGDTKPSRSWFKLGFPCGYVADACRTWRFSPNSATAGIPGYAAPSIGSWPVSGDKRRDVGWCPTGRR